MKTNISVTTSETEVLPARRTRKFIILQNVSDTDIYLDFTSDTDALTTANGIKIEAGDTMILDGLEGGAFTNAVTAIHGGSGAKSLRVQEEV